jgi:magnesium transporter
MKLLAIFSAIMLPLSLIAGIYGMNFEHMPELKTPYGYYMTIGFMILVAVTLLYYFWRKGWILESTEDRSETNVDNEDR